MRSRARYSVLLAATLSCAHPTTAPEVPIASAANPCAHRIDIEASRGVLHEQRALGRPWFDFAGGYPRGPVHVGTFRPVAATEAITYLDQPVLWFTPDREQAVLRDDAFLTDVTAVDATALSTGSTPITLGQAAPSFVRAAEPRRVAEFLIRADLVRIYAHIEGNVCLETESNDAAAWTGHYRGDHTFFTNDENHARIAFALTIAADGTIQIRGE